MTIIKQLYNKPLLEDGNPDKLPVYPISVASAIYDKYNTVLQTLIDEGYKYLGIATPTSPEVAPTPHQNCFYLAATEGTYSQFGGVALEKYQLGIIKFTEGTWTLDVLAKFYQKPATGIPLADIESGVIPENTSDLTNDSGFITSTVNNLTNYYDKTNVYTKQEIRELINSSQGVSIKYADTLPTASVDTLGSIYLVPTQEPKAANEKDEYITITTSTGYKWESIGSTAISLDGYVTDAELTAALNSYVTTTSLNTLLLGKQDKLVSGENIKTINGNSILGSGNITIEAAGTPTWGSITGTLSNQTDLANALAGKQNTISDIETIRSGASAGATAYQKPSTGIPETDLSTALRDKINAGNAFIATSETTIDELYDAYTAGKTLFFADSVDDANYIYVLNYVCVSSLEDSAFYFSCLAADEQWVCYAYLCYGEEWEQSNYYIQTAEDTDIFWATYGTTTRQEIINAVMSNKVVALRYENEIYYGQYINTTAGNTNNFFFGCVNNGTAKTIYLQPNGTWGGPMGVTIENANNRVQTIIDNESNTSKYPSTKAVADYVASKTEVFVAERGVTTYAQIVAAASAGKVVICKDSNNHIAYLHDIPTNGATAYFTSILQGQALLIQCTSADAWSGWNTNLEVQANKKTAWSSTPSDTNYPSEKLVKDSLDAKQDTLTSGTNIKTINNESLLGSGNITINADTSDCVKTTQQSLTSAQQLQARANINTLSPNYQGTVTPVTTSAETVQNKVTSISNSSTDTEYPSAKAVYDSLYKYGVVSQTMTRSGSSNDGYAITVSNPVYGKIPISFIEQVEGYFLYKDPTLSPKFNETTGYFELNGITNIAYDEMLRIYNYGDIFRYYTTGDMYVNHKLISGNTMVGVRTLLPTGVNKNIAGGFIRYLNVEVLRITQDTYIAMAATNVGYSFYNALDYLREVKDEIRFTNQTAYFASTCFRSCWKLETLTINKLPTSISLSESPHLSKASILYMIEHENAANNITITLHATAYAMATADSDITTALASHTKVSLASA